jgi:hypothetical protein
MKRALLLLLVLVFVFALFAGCKDKDTVIESPSASAPAATEEPSDTEAPEVTEEPSPYNFAIGKVALNDKGLPTEKYEYPSRFLPQMKFSRFGTPTTWSPGSPTATIRLHPFRWR